MSEKGAVPPVGKQRIDGASLVPLLKHGKPPAERPLFWHYPHYGNQGGAPGGAIRLGDYKLVEWYEDGRRDTTRRNPAAGRRSAPAANLGPRRRYGSRAASLLLLARGRVYNAAHARRSAPTSRCSTALPSARSTRWKITAAGAKKTCRNGWAMGAFEYRQAEEIRDDIIASKAATNRQKDKESLPRLQSFREYWMRRCGARGE